MLKLGDKVRKIKGYNFDGIVMSIFENSKGQKRVIVEHLGSQNEDSGGMLHIFSVNQLEKVNSIEDIEVIKNDFRYKWSKLFASKRYNSKNDVISLDAIEQLELLDDSDNYLSGCGINFLEERLRSIEKRFERFDRKNIK